MDCKEERGLSGPSSMTQFEVRDGRWNETYAKLQTLCFKVQQFLLANPDAAEKVEITKQDIKSFLETE